jgi:hypothetical protein
VNLHKKQTDECGDRKQSASLGADSDHGPFGSASRAVEDAAKRYRGPLQENQIRRAC